MYVSSGSGQRNLLTRSGLTEVSVTICPDVDSFVLAPRTEAKERNRQYKAPFVRLVPGPTMLSFKCRLYLQMRCVQSVRVILVQ
jgi:hypothetical protein